LALGLLDLDGEPVVRELVVAVERELARTVREEQSARA
jgi:hypothetical protein